MRSIRKIIPSQKVNMGGIILDQPLPSREADQIDPFLLVHHWRQVYKGGQQQREIGVGPHPHRGFAPVTFIFKGGVHHRDSTGHEGVIYAGGTQWMNSGKGLVHSERPAKEIAENGGEFEIIQFWVNAPAKNKMDQPNYQPLAPKDTPVVWSADKKVKTAVVSGDYKGVKGVINTYTPLLTLRFEIDVTGKTEVDIPEDHNAFIYLLDGALVINGNSDVTKKDLVWFNNDGGKITLEGKAKTRAILLAGKPINEPVATYGPFVMNTQAEIMEAMRDYQSGKMGQLIEKFG